ncbi:MAG: CHAD domain-containing protein [Rhodospirillales bacterium]|nr:CHAD domain-containing protein [Rhodospirillales bacterium]
MTDNSQFFAVSASDGSALDGKALNEKITVALGGETSSKATSEYSRTYLETFDWRLFEAGTKLVLLREKDAKASWLHWINSTDSPGGQLRVQVKKAPLLAEDFPTGLIRDKVTSLLEMRSLSLKAEVVTQERAGVILDELGKTVVRFTLEKNKLRSQDSKSFDDLGYRLRLEAVRGYSANFRKARAKLKTVPGLKPVDDLLMEQAFEKIGRRPLDYSSKEAAILKPTQGTWDACRQILLVQLAHIERNVDGTIKDLDSEFLHDLRVAVRRSRSLINRIKDSFPDEVLNRFSTDLAWVGEVTGPTRDMDVYLLDFPKYRDSLSDDAQKDILPLHDYLVAHQKKQQRILAKNLRSARFKKFINDWHTYLNQKSPPLGLPETAGISVRTTADQRIWKTYRRVIREGSAIGNDTPAEALHDLRKTCKKLRYLLEFFASLYKEQQVKGLVKSLKILQDNLGVFQDLDVQAASLKEFGRDMMTEGGHQSETLMAMGMLVDGFMRRKVDVRNQFYDRFTSFASPANLEQFKQLCNRPIKITAEKQPSKEAKQ